MGTVYLAPANCDGHNNMTMSKRIAKRGATVGSAEFKATCLELIDRVKESRVEYTVTRHGRPVARLVPVEVAGPASLIGALPNSVQRYDAPFEPAPAVWNLASRKGDGS